jgi:hypothetical protein
MKSAIIDQLRSIHRTSVSDHINKSASVTSVQAAGSRDVYYRSGSDSALPNYQTVYTHKQRGEVSAQWRRQFCVYDDAVELLRAHRLQRLETRMRRLPNVKITSACNAL